MSTDSTKTLGQIGYEAYGAAAGWKTFDGRPMPTWEQLLATETGRETVRRWEVSAGEVSADVHAYLHERRPTLDGLVHAAAEALEHAGIPEQADTLRDTPNDGASLEQFVTAALSLVGDPTARTALWALGSAAARIEGT